MNTYQKFSKLKDELFRRKTGVKRKTKDTSKFKYSIQEKEKYYSLKRRKTTQSQACFQENLCGACYRQIEEIQSHFGKIPKQKEKIRTEI